MRMTDLLELVARRGMQRYVEKRGGILSPLTLISPLPSLLGRHAIDKSKEYTDQLEHAEDTKLAADMSWAGKPAGPSQGLLNFRRFFQDPSGGMGFPPQYKAPAPQTASQGPTPSRPSMGPGSMQSSGLLASLLMSGAQNSMTQSGAQGIGEGIKGVAGSPLKGIAEGVSGGIGETIKRKMLGREFGERKDPLHLGGTAAMQTLGKGIGEMGVDLLRDMAAKAMSAVGHAGDDAAREAILSGLKRTDPVLSSADDATLMEAYHTMTRFAPVLSTDKNAVRSFLRQAVMSGSGPDYSTIKLLADSERAVTGGNEKRSSFGHSKRHSEDDVPLAALRGLLAGGGTGAAVGAAANPDDRLKGMLIGGLTGAGVGAAGSGAHELAKPRSFWYGAHDNPSNFWWGQ